MESKELRIWNLVKIYNLEVNVYRIVIGETSGMGIINRTPDVDVYPIPLTEEWLVRFGFTVWDSTPDCFVKEYGRNGDFCLFNSNTLVAKANDIKHGEYYYTFNKVIHTIQFVHQLQNLYFALTGQELTNEEKC